MSIETIQIPTLYVHNQNWKRAGDFLPPLGKLVTIQWRQEMKGHCIDQMTECFAVLEIYGQSLLRWKIGVDRTIDIKKDDEWIEL